MRSLVVGLALVVAAGLTACGDDGGGSVPEYGDDSQPISAEVGDEFAIRLEANPSTGYTWELRRPLDDAVVVAKGSEFERGESDAPGAPGHEVLTYEAVGAGTTKIALGYLRTFEDAPPVETATFTVEVR